MCSMQAPSVIFIWHVYNVKVFQKLSVFKHSESLILKVWLRLIWDSTEPFERDASYTLFMSKKYTSHVKYTNYPFQCNTEGNVH